MKWVKWVAYLFRTQTVHAVQQAWEIGIASPSRGGWAYARSAGRIQDEGAEGGWESMTTVVGCYEEFFNSCLYSVNADTTDPLTQPAEVSFDL